MENTKDDTKDLALGSYSNDDDCLPSSSYNKIFRIKNHIYYYADIDTKNIAKLHELLIETFKEYKIQADEFHCNPIHINLHIMSRGGHVFAGLSGYDLITKVQEFIPVYTIVEGITASAATFLSLAGTERFMTPSSFMLIHEISSFLYGKTSEIKEQYNNHLKVQETMEKIYLQKTKIEIKELKEILKRDTLLDAEQALQYGLVDKIDSIIF